MAKKRIGILTGGGDVPGVNAAIKSIVQRLDLHGYEAVGLRRGWAALINVTPDDDEVARRKWVAPLSVQNTRSIDRTLGTVSQIFVSVASG